MSLQETVSCLYSPKNCINLTSSISLQEVFHKWLISPRVKAVQPARKFLYVTLFIFLYYYILMFLLYSHRESNPDLRFRRALFYPLNYENALLFPFYLQPASWSSLNDCYSMYPTNYIYLQTLENGGRWYNNCMNLGFSPFGKVLHE